MSRNVKLTDDPFRYCQFELEFKEHMKQKIAEACLPDCFLKGIDHFVEETYKAFMERFTPAVSTDDYDFLWGYCWEAAEAAIDSWIECTEARHREWCYPTLWNIEHPHQVHYEVSSIN